LKVLRGIARRTRLKVSGPSTTPSVFRAPGHYYSPLLGTADIERRSDPRAEVRSLPLDERELWEHLSSLAPVAATLALNPRPTAPSHYFTDNRMYGPGDAAVYYSMIQVLRPRRIVEVGSGFSTAIALDAVADLQTTLTTIDPDPRRLRELGLMGHARINVITQPVQGVGLELFESLDRGDFLFLDTSHVGKTGSDVLWHLFEVFPRLRPGVYVHMHDIFPGFEYPLEWMQQGRSWNEAYLLRAFLEFNNRFEVFLWPVLSWMRDPERAVKLVPHLRENPGGQIWLRVKDESVGEVPALHDAHS
jgi:predicted O-methyltransferase YrrM